LASLLVRDKRPAHREILPRLHNVTTEIVKFRDKPFTSSARGMTLSEESAGTATSSSSSSNYNDDGQQRQQHQHQSI
jgi:hypothetical protein